MSDMPSNSLQIDARARYFGNVRQVSLDNMNNQPGEWTLTIASVGDDLEGQLNQINPNAIEDIILILRYTVGQS